MGEDGSFSWLPMARGHRGVHTEGSELSCHGPGGGTHCGEENPGQGPLREGTSTLPAWRPPYPQPSMPTDSPTAQPCCPHPKAEEGSLPLPRVPTAGQCGAVSPCLSFPRWGGGSPRSRKLCPVPPRPAPPYLARTAGPESGPHPTAPPSRPPPREPRRHRAAAAAAPPESGEHRDGPGVPAPSRSSDPDAPPVTGKSPRSAQPDPIGVSPGTVQPDRPRRAADARAKGNGAGAPPPPARRSQCPSPGRSPVRTAGAEPGPGPVASRPAAAGSGTRKEAEAPGHSRSALPPAPWRTGADSAGSLGIPQRCSGPNPAGCTVRRDHVRHRSAQPAPSPSPNPSPPRETDSLGTLTPPCAAPHPEHCLLQHPTERGNPPGALGSPSHSTAALPG